MNRIKLREEGDAPWLGHNMHVLGGHERLTFLENNYRPGRILDVGCGEGAFSIWCVKRGNMVHAIDVHDMPKYLEGTGVNYEKIAVEEYKTSLKFNTIILMEIIEHLKDPEAVIKKLFGYLLPKGRMIITTPWIDTWDWEADHLWRWPDLASFNKMFKDYEFALTHMDDTFLYGVLING